MKVKQGKIHIPRPGTEYKAQPETYCGLIIEPQDELGRLGENRMTVYYGRSKREVPSDLICLACLRIAKPCLYEIVRDGDYE